MNTQFSNTIQRHGCVWVPWQTLSLDSCPPHLDLPPTWQADLERVGQECRQALVSSKPSCMIEGRTLYLEQAAAKRVLCWRRAKERTTSLTLAKHKLSFNEQQEVYASLEGLALPQSTGTAESESELD